MARWLRWVSVSGLVGAVAAGCGSGSGGESFSNPPADDASGHDGNADDGTVDSSQDDASPDTGGDDADATIEDSGPGAPDVGLDITMPDVFWYDAGDTGADAPADASGDGAEAGCMPNGITCSANIALICNNGNLTTQNCAQQNKVCADGFGCVVCQPGTGSCNGNVGTACKNDGSGWVTNNCDPQLGETCANGLCVGDCANLGASYIGCEYYTVTLPNDWLDQTTFYYSVSLSNTSSKTANIVITGPNNFNQSDTIAAGLLKEYKLPWVQPLSCGSGPCNGSQPPAPGTLLQANGAYHVKSTEPLSAYQFNARDYTLNGSFSYTNDASLLIPVNALTGNYRAMTFPTFYNQPGYIAVIGTVANTQVTVTTTNPIQAGAGLSTNGGTVTIGAGDVLLVGSAQNASMSYPFPYGTDPSGTVVAANNPVEVFGAHACVYIPSSMAACDHMEEINFPNETLGKDYLVTLPYNSNGTPKQFVKIVGITNGTALTFDPAVQSNQTINAGQVLYFETTQHFHVSGNNAFAVGQYMEGAQNFGGSTTAGDPAQSIAVATVQFRKDYQFVAPANYAQNWVNVIAQPNATITIDGNPVPNNSFVAIGASGWSVAKVSLCGNNSCNGVHKAVGNQPFGIEVYGYGSYTSYMFPGGLNLTRQ